MPDDAKLPVRASNQDLQALPFEQALDAYAPNFADALPDHIPLDRFKRVVITAVSQNPDLARADRRSLFTACVRCAQDGLYPDDREAHLEVYNTKRGDAWVKQVQYMPMIAGIRKRMRNTGEVLSAIAEVVYRNDKFHQRRGDDPMIEHEPPPLDQERGDPVGAYAIIKLANGEVIREVMSRRDIEGIRDQHSKSYRDRQGNVNSRSPWATSPGEMWRKTVMRRASKQAPNGSEMERLFQRVDEAEAALPAPEPPRPQRQDFVEHEPVPEPERPYAFADQFGELHEFADAGVAALAYQDALGSAATLIELEAVWENGTAMVKEMIARGARRTADEIIETHHRHLLAIKRGSAGAPPAADDGMGDANISAGPPAEPAGERNAPPTSQAAETGTAAQEPQRAARAPRNQPQAGRPPEQAGSSPAPAGATANRDKTESVPAGGDQAPPISQTTRGKTLPFARPAPEPEEDAFGLPPIPAEPPPRDAFWSQEKFVIPGTTPQEIVYYLDRHLRQALDVLDVNGIELDSADKFAAMPKAYREQAAEMIEAMRKELEGATS